MPWHKLKPQHQFGKTATLREDGIALSGEFIQGENLLKHGWAELFIDSALHRVGFKFHDTQTGNTYKLSKESKTGRMLQTTLLQTYPWISDILDNPVSERRFLVETDDLEGRLKQHAIRYKDGIDEYDFSEIEDAGARKLEEKRLLEEFKDAYGRLPKLNTITA